jgi:hypothetical protein
MDIDNSTAFSVAFVVGFVVVTAVKWLVYTGLLWGMIKIQKLNYNVLGLFGSSLAATLVAFIPYAGPYLSYVVLVLCLWKCTGADIAPDVIFTVGIAGALMFCFNLFVIGSLMGDLRPDFAHARDGAEPTGWADADMEDEEDDSELAEKVAAATNAASAAAAPTKAAPAKTGGPLALKGVTYAARRPLVMIADGSRVHTVTTGETFSVTWPQGRVKWRCERVTKTSVVVQSEQGEQIELHIQ